MIELIVTIALIGVVLTLAVPGVRSVREEARRVKQISAAASMVAGVSAYAASNADMPPILFAPPTTWPEPTQSVTIGSASWDGWWWSNPRMFYLAMDPQFSLDILRGEHPPNSTMYPVTLASGPSLYISPWILTGTLYAAPDYFVPENQAPLRGWRGQALSEIAAPSQKGFIEQLVFIPSTVDGVAGPVVVPTHQYIGWSDGSANRQPIAALKRTVANRFAPWGNPAGSHWGGPGISNTYWGVKGMDR